MIATKSTSITNSRCTCSNVNSNILEEEKNGNQSSMACALVFLHHAQTVLCCYTMQRHATLQHSSCKMPLHLTSLGYEQHD